MDTIKDVVQDVLKDLKEKKQAKDAPELLLSIILSKKELRHVKFRYLRKGVLGVTVESSSWLYQFNLQKSDLLAKIGKKSKSIKDIRFYIGETK